MPDDVFNRIASVQTLRQCNQAGILCIGKWCDVAAFQFNANGIIIAAIFALPVGYTGMPGAIVAGYKLDDRTVAADKKMCGYFESL